MSHLLPIVCPGHIRPVVALRYCQTSDDLNLLVTSSHDKTAQVRWGEDGAWIGSFVGHQGAVWSTALDKEGRRAVTGSADFSCKVWDVSSGALLATFPHDHVVKAVDFAMDSKRFLSGGFDKKAHCYDLETEKLLASFPHTQQVSNAVWIGNQEFVTGARDGVLRKWDARSQQQVSSTNLATSSVTARGVTDIEFTPDYGLVACCSRTAVLLDVGLQAHTRITCAFELESASRNVNKLLCAGQDIHVFDLTSQQQSEAMAVFRGHHGPVFTCRFDPTTPNASAPTTTNFASGSGDGTIRIWKSCDSV